MALVMSLSKMPVVRSPKPVALVLGHQLLKTGCPARSVAMAW